MVALVTALLTVGLMACAISYMYGDLRDLPGPLDAQTQLIDAATKATSGDLGDVVDLGENFAPDPVHPVRIGLNVTALDFAQQDETYQLELQESADGETYTPTGLKFDVESTGTYHFVAGVSKRYQKWVLTVSGSSPSITASSWMVPLRP